MVAAGGPEMRPKLELDDGKLSNGAAWGVEEDLAEPRVGGIARRSSGVGESVGGDTDLLELVPGKVKRRDETDKRGG